MNNSFKKNVFKSLNVVIIPSNPVDLTDEGLAKAMQFNDFLIKEYNVSFNARDIITLARNNNDNSAIDSVYSFIEEVYHFSDNFSKARAMFTPEEAANISTEMFRFTQLMHYFSTYGLEDLLGTNVSHGWLPSEAGLSSNEEPKEDDITLIQPRLISLLFEEEAYFTVYKKIVSKRNRATILEKHILKEAIANLSIDELCSVKISFKENLPLIFLLATELDNKEDTIKLIKNTHRNCNDVLRSLRVYLGKNRYKLTTSQKKLMVKILESYPVEDFKSNLVLTGKVREINLVSLNHLDYNKYSRSKEHAKAVLDLREDSLKSFNSKVDSAFKTSPSEALKVLSTRPGLLLRSMNRLLKAGLSPKEILENLKLKAESLSIQTLVENANIFYSNNYASKNENAQQLASLNEEILKQTLSVKNTPIKDKKIYIESGDFSLEDSLVMFNSASAESDYISSGLAYKFPTTAKVLRLFTYWENDIHGQRVDIDAHYHLLTNDNKPIHIGWNASHRDGGVYTSGDITHSYPYGCEYLDVDLDKTDVKCGLITINSFTNQPFSDINNFAVGILPISKVGLRDSKKLFTSKNAIFFHELKSNLVNMDYGFVDFKKGIVRFVGARSGKDIYSYSKEQFEDYLSSSFSVRDYINVLAEAQGATIVDNPEEADLILKLTKPQSEKEISLIDNNYFADCK